MVKAYKGQHQSYQNQLNDFNYSANSNSSPKAEIIVVGMIMETPNIQHQINSTKTKYKNIN